MTIIGSLVLFAAVYFVFDEVRECKSMIKQTNDKIDRLYGYLISKDKNGVGE